MMSNPTALMSLIAEMVQKGNISESALHKIIVEHTPAVGLDQIIYFNPINSAKKINELLKCGGYAWVNENISKYISSTEENIRRELHTVLIPFDFIQKAEQIGCSTTKANEVLSLGIRYPYLQSELEIRSFSPILNDTVVTIGPIETMHVAGLRKPYEDLNPNVRFAMNLPAGGCDFDKLKRQFS